MFEYNSRETRHKFLCDEFSDFLKGSILNIGGGGKKHLLKYINPKEYLELDITGNPDIKIDLDNTNPIPIEDNRFDTIICTDVLEHLEELHQVFSELIRISNKYLIISVPNAWKGFSITSRKVYNGNAGEAGIDVGKYKKFYGLPLNKPIDRHRWFFSYTEAEEFFRKNSNTLSYRIVREYAIGEKTNSIKGRIYRVIMKFFLKKNVYKDWFYNTYWCIIEKK